MDRVVQSQPARQAAIRAGLAAAADQQVDRPARSGCAADRAPRAVEQRLQALEREVVADEQADQVARLQASRLRNAQRTAPGCETASRLGSIALGTTWICWRGTW